MATLRDEILAFKQEPNEPLHEIWERYRTMVTECPNNDMTEAMIQQTLYRGINTTNQCVVNQLAGRNFMTMPYAEACEILDEMADTSSAWQSRANVPQGDPNVIHPHKELHNHGQVIAELTTTMNQLAKAQLQQGQGPKKVNAMEGVSMMVNKRKQKGQQVQNRVEHFVQDDSGFDQDESYNEQEEEVQYVKNYQGQRNNSQGPSQQQWHSLGNQGNWNNQNHQGNWSGGNNNKGFQRPPMYQQPSNLPPYPSRGSSSSNNEMGRVENMFKQMIKKNADSYAQLASHNTSIQKLEVQLWQISQALNTRPKKALPSDTVVNPKGGNNTGYAMAVTTWSGKCGEATTSNQRRVMDDDVVIQEDEIPSNLVQANKEVRIEIDAWRRSKKK
ncbi:uncharacterized protein [Nicotiana tomentosiformis]|uniref:uncharacterized protein n=1 Tax=Nicotiana tomentosiformis TaxID=4098 RepID=UPI00388CC127